MKTIIYLFMFLIVLSGCSGKRSQKTILTGGKIQIMKETVNKAVLPSEFMKLINTGKYTVIDIRTDQELSQFGYIFGMNYHYDMYKTEDVKKILSLPKDKKYLIYCYHGNRTVTMRDYMIKNGFTHVIDLSGGTDLRTKQGYELVH